MLKKKIGDAQKHPIDVNMYGDLPENFMSSEDKTNRKQLLTEIKNFFELMKITLEISPIRSPIRSRN